MNEAAIYREALEAIVNPIQHLEKEAAKNDCQIDGAAAVNLAGSVSYLRELAQSGLRKGARCQTVTATGALSGGRTKP